MSIIQEALKKAQNYIGQTPREEPISPESTKAVKPPLEANGILARRPVALSRRKGGPNMLLVAALFVTITFALKEFLPELKFKNKAKSKEAVEAECPGARQEVIYKVPAQGTPLIKPQYPELMLNGIMYLAERPQAIINNFVVEEGDTVSGARVVSIKRNKVLLSYEDAEITLTLKK